MAPQRGWFWALGRAFIAVTAHAASFHFFQHYQPDAVFVMSRNGSSPNAFQCVRALERKNVEHHKKTP